MADVRLQEKELSRRQSLGLGVLVVSAILESRKWTCFDQWDIQIPQAGETIDFKPVVVDDKNNTLRAEMDLSAPSILAKSDLMKKP